MAAIFPFREDGLIRHQNVERLMSSSKDYCKKNGLQLYLFL
jgi:hypothetical protein